MSWCSMEQMNQSKTECGKKLRANIDPVVSVHFTSQQGLMQCTPVTPLISITQAPPMHGGLC